MIDGSGKYLMPGLWDMHTHALLGGSGPAREALSLYLVHGVVGVRDLGSTLEELSEVKGKLPLGTELPHLVAGGPVLDGPKQPWQQKVALALNTVEEARAAAEKLAESGVDFLKIYNNLSEEQFVAVAEVAKRRGVPMAGHVPFKVSLETVSAAGQKSIEHAGMQLAKDCIPDGAKATPAVLNAWIRMGYPGKNEETSRWWAKRDQPVCNALYARMSERGTWVTPTLTNEVQGGLWASAYDLSLLPPERLKSCESNLQSVNSQPQLRDTADRDLFNLVLDLHRAGVPLLAGTDTPNSCLAYGSSLHKELQMLRHAGLSPWEVLKTATLNAARFLGRADEGAVREGAIANLLLLDADPLADIANTRKIAGVMLGGRWKGAQALQELQGRVEPTTIYDNGMVWNGSGFAPRRLAVRHGRFVDPGTIQGASRVDLGGGFIVPAYGNAHAHETNPTAAGSWNYLKEGVFYVWNPNTVVMNQAAQDFFARKDTVDVVVAQGGITEPGGHPEKLYVDVLSKYVYKGMALKDFLGNAFHYGRDKAEIDAALDLLKKQKAAFVKTYLLYSEEYAKRRTNPAYYGWRGVNPVHMPYLVAAARKRGLPVAVHVETAHDLRIAALSGAAV
ncbi:MAG: amidohydrolase family protein, partial [Pseudomonadota bacterium]|nr:amidohydrolase family protein [Pseudomonadota bacterium]